MPDWPEDWDQRKDGKGCPMCASGRPAETEFDATSYWREVLAPFGPLPHDGEYITFPDGQVRVDAAALQARLAE